jgi:hypothetical protein
MRSRARCANTVVFSAAWREYGHGTVGPGPPPLVRLPVPARSPRPSPARKRLRLGYEVGRRCGCRRNPQRAIRFNSPPASLNKVHRHIWKDLHTRPAGCNMARWRSTTRGRTDHQPDQQAAVTDAPGGARRISVTAARWPTCAARPRRISATAAAGPLASRARRISGRRPLGPTWRACSGRRPRTRLWPTLPRAPPIRPSPMLYPFGEYRLRGPCATLVPT